MEWCHNPAIQRINPRSQQILTAGAIYTYGRDRKDRPIVVLDLCKIDLETYELDNYYCAINAVISVVAQHCFVKGVIETYLFVIDMGGKNFTSLPLEAIGSIIKKLAVVYSMYLGEMLVINTQYFIKLSYYALRGFIDESTRQKIHLLDSSELEKIHDFIEPSQLPIKHKGYNPDLDEYWPPKVPGQPSTSLNDETMYYSILENNESFFKDDTENATELTQSGSCCTKNDCRLF